MQVEKGYSIDGLVVEKIASFMGLDIFSHETDESCTTLFFCKKDKIIQKLMIQADCAQNCGFISDIDFVNVD